MRRGWLYNKAKELGCNKIALGHHFDDVIETTLMNMLNSGSFQTMLPKLHSDNYEGMELIRPLYLVKEEDILAWKKFNDIDFINCACKFTEKSMVNENDSKRREMKELIKHMRKSNPNIDHNLFTSLANINLEKVTMYNKISYKTIYIFTSQHPNRFSQSSKLGQAERILSIPILSAMVTP